MTLRLNAQGGLRKADAKRALKALAKQQEDLALAKAAANRQVREALLSRRGANGVPLVQGSGVDFHLMMADAILAGDIVEAQAREVEQEFKRTARRQRRMNAKARQSAIGQAKAAPRYRRKGKVAV